MDIELAEIAVAEKGVQLQLLEQEYQRLPASGSTRPQKELQLRLAKLAVRKAEIELQRARESAKVSAKPSDARRP